MLLLRLNIKLRAENWKIAVEAEGRQKGHIFIFAILLLLDIDSLVLLW